MWKGLSFWKQKERREDEVQGGNPLFKSQAVGAILSPALISSSLRPSGLGFLTSVSPSSPRACFCSLARLNTCQVASDRPPFLRWHIPGFTPQDEEGQQDARWRKRRVKSDTHVTLFRVHSQSGRLLCSVRVQVCVGFLQGLLSMILF